MEDAYSLLAKKPRDGQSRSREETLAGHTEAVIQTFAAMFGGKTDPSRLTLEWLRFFKLSIDCAQAFWLNTMAACGLHDIGKANSAFQKAVTGSKAGQPVYHEHLSALLLFLPGFRNWLEEAQILNARVVICAVAGHHLRVNHGSLGALRNPDSKRFAVFPEAVHDIVRITARSLEIPEPGVLSVPADWSFENRRTFQHIHPLIEAAQDDLHQFRRQLRREDQQLRLLMAVRSALILADAAGSGLTRERKVLVAWLHDAFAARDLLRRTYIDHEIIQPRIKQIESATSKPFEWSSFQEASETLADRALLLAACGSGKTLAAWRWVKSRLGHRPVKRAIFLYPTRATATEGFRDYVSWAPEADAALLHGTSNYELQEMFSNPEDDGRHRDFTTEDRLFAIGCWPKRVFSATVDQFLGFMQHSYRSTCLLPMLADSVVVIDEVHSFDRNLFSALKRFLKSFELPVLCMTASLPQQRANDLKECGLKVFPEDISQFSELSRSARMDRYKVRRIDGVREAKIKALEALESGKRVLWVVNQVARCQGLARELGALCYHSRFSLKHRKIRHDEVIARFKPAGGRVLAVTTQVCEMSLDLNAHVLITETAPITSLIQRMGRCNRKSIPEDNRIGQVYIYEPQDILPYCREELKGVAEFLKEIDGKTTSQLRLQELLEQFGPSKVEVERYAAFLESGPWAMHGEERLRDSKDATVPAIIDEDMEEYLKLRREGKPTDGLVVPCPRRLARQDPRLGRFLKVAPPSYYHPDYGLLDEPWRVDNE